jgi:hypothetical protein
MFRLFLLLSITAFGASLFLPVYAEKPDLIGLFALGMGWLVGVNDLATAISWLGNVMYILSVVMILKRKKPRPRTAFVFAIFAVLFGASILAAGKFFISVSETIDDLTLGAAFYAWMASFVLMVIAARLKMKKLKPAPVVNEQVVDEPANVK